MCVRVGVSSARHRRVCVCAVEKCRMRASHSTISQIVWWSGVEWRANNKSHEEDFR